jgi:hypothetical protein
MSAKTNRVKHKTTSPYGSGSPKPHNPKQIVISSHRLKGKTFFSDLDVKITEVSQCGYKINGVAYLWEDVKEAERIAALPRCLKPS